MTGIALEELAKVKGAAGVLLKYAGENKLEVVVKEDGHGFHYFISVGDAKDEDQPLATKAATLFDSMVNELLSLEGGHLARWEPRYWVRENSDRSDARGRHYATTSLARFVGSYRTSETIHFFLSREDFDVAIKYARPTGWSNNE